MPSDSHDPNHTDRWQVTQCACGQLTVKMGSLRIEFTRDEFAQLHRLLHQAMEHFQLEPSGAPVVHSKSFMH